MHILNLAIILKNYNYMKCALMCDGDRVQTYYLVVSKSAK